MSRQKLRVLSTGLDNIYFSGYGDLRPGVLDDLERWRDQAKAEGERLRVNLWRTGTPFLVKEHGARGYSYLLTSDDMDLIVGAARNFPPLRVELRSAYLHAMTEWPAVARLVEILGRTSSSGDPDLQASRIDLYADLQGWPLVKADLDRFVTRARLRGLSREELMKDGRRLTGFRFGRSALMARIQRLEADRSRVGSCLGRRCRTPGGSRSAVRSWTGSAGARSCATRLQHDRAALQVVTWSGG